MNPKTFLSFIPWLLFSVMINRIGDDFAGTAATVAAALALIFLIRDHRTGVKIIDAAGVGTFAVLAIVCFAGGDSTSKWVADYGRGAATLALAVIMLVSAVTVPFSEQYARETVDRAYWKSPVFRRVNRKISAVWGTAIAVMAGSHFLAGFLDPLSNPNRGSRPIDLIFNWLVPIALIIAAVDYTRRTSTAASERANASDLVPERPIRSGTTSHP